MCNLYNVTTNHEAIRQFSMFLRDRAGNLEPSIEVYPDQAAPIVRNGRDASASWCACAGACPSSSGAFATKKRADRLRSKGKEIRFDELMKMEPDRGVTNIRNTGSKHWSRWLGVPNRCVVPFTRRLRLHAKGG